MKKVLLDCIGDACPVPLIKTENAVKPLAVGDVLVVYIDHSCAMKNIPEWAMKQGYNIDIDELGSGEWEIVIEKTK